VAQLNPKNGHLYVMPEYIDRIELRMSFDNFVPKIEIFDTESDLLLFWVTLPVKQLLGIEMFV
jgi:hypothetical protein